MFPRMESFYPYIKEMFPLWNDLPYTVYMRNVPDICRTFYPIFQGNVPYLEFFTLNVK